MSCQPLLHPVTERAGGYPCTDDVWTGERSMESCLVEYLYHRILCYSHYSQHAVDIGGSAKVVGNPRFDEWHNHTYDTALPKSVKLNAKKQTILYAPTYGALSSLPHWAQQLSRLSHEYNVVTKLHHGTLHRPEESASLVLAQRYLKTELTIRSTCWRLWRRQITS